MTWRFGPSWSRGVGLVVGLVDGDHELADVGDFAARAVEDAKRSTLGLVV
jgi:hypothetical protein